MSLSYVCMYFICQNPIRLQIVVKSIKKAFPRARLYTRVGNFKTFSLSG